MCGVNSNKLQLDEIILEGTDRLRLLCFNLQPNKEIFSELNLLATWKIRQGINEYLLVTWQTK